MAASEMGGLVGELALSDASLSALLTDMREALTQHGQVTGSKPQAKTTGTLAKNLLGMGKSCPALVPPGLRPWLLRVDSAAEQRNAVIHAIGRDRCRDCGTSSIFELNHQPVDRSSKRLHALLADIDTLIDEGIELADELSSMLNKLLLDRARERARATGATQLPPQINIVGGWHRCAACSPDGQAIATLQAPSAAAVLPPGTDLQQLLPE